MHLDGSCHCGAVRFGLESASPVPCMHCHCSICRKTAGSGGFAINLGGDAATLKVRGRKHLGVYHAVLREPGERSRRSHAGRHFCLKCGSPLLLSDVLDCQWLQQLMTCGLLRGAFRPVEQVCVLRALYRQRGMLLRSQGRHVQHMQKALTQMNVQLANVLSDIVGESGQKILRAIVAGERDGQVLGAMKNVRVRASVDEIAKSLQGNWRAEHLFALEQALDAFDFVGTQLAECDTEIELQLQRLQVHDADPAKGKKRGRARNAPKFDLRTQLFRMCGVDLTRIDGVDVTTALAVVSEVGTDMSRFPTIKHFTCWLGLCPGTKITGGKVMSGKTKRVVNRAAQALRLAAAALRSSKSALGAYFRRMCSRMDKPKAVTAAAHKLARLIYTMLTKGQEYTDQGQDYYEERYRERVLRALSQRAARARHADGPHCTTGLKTSFQINHLEGVS
ncbi:MAG: IS110 family transposase [Pseudomonadota bacterium]